MHSRSTESQDWPPEKIAAARTIQRLMAFWQIQPSELASPPEPVPEPCAPATPAAPKYRHPVSGETWDGQGSQPQWLREALLKEGYLVEELRLSGEHADAPPGPISAEVAEPAGAARAAGELGSAAHSLG